MAKETKHLNIPLPTELHTQLKQAAEQQGEPTTVLAREAIRVWLKNFQHEKVAREMSEFAQRFGGTRYDDYPALVPSAVQFLRERPAKPSRKGRK